MWAVFASIIIPGLGQMLQGRINRGFAWFFGFIASAILTSGLVIPFVYIGVVLDAFLWNGYKKD